MIESFNFPIFRIMQMLGRVWYCGNRQDSILLYCPPELLVVEDHEVGHLH